MMHAAESAAEESFLIYDRGIYADGLARRNVEWSTPGISTIQYLKERSVLGTRPLLAHCIRVDEKDIETLAETKSKVAHCPKSNAKLGHGRAPLATFLDRGIEVGLGSDSVASNNTCDMLEEARFAALIARSDRLVTASEAMSFATIGGAGCLGMKGSVGEITEGLQADLVVLSLNESYQFPTYDPVVSTIFLRRSRCFADDGCRKRDLQGRASC